MAIGDDFSIATNGNIRHTDGTKNYTVLELHRWLQELADDPAGSTNDLLDITSDTPSERLTNDIIILQSPFNVDDATAMYLYAGSISQLNGNTLYSGLKITGQVNSTNTQLVIIQNNKLYPFTDNSSTPFWGTQNSGGHNGNVELSVLMRVLIKTREFGADIDLKKIRIQSRHWGDTYDFCDMILDYGESTVKINTSIDLQNNTAQSTVTGYTHVVNSGGTANAPTGGLQSININNGNGLLDYYSQWSYGSNTSADGIKGIYEYTKDLSATGTSKTIDGLNGELFYGITHDIPYIANSLTETTVYLIGAVNDYLSTLDTTTGIATRVGSSINFGIGEDFPSALASLGDTLYMIGSTNDYLSTLDATTGVATRVGNAHQFGIGENNPRGLAFIGNTLYMIGSTTDYLTTVDTTSGVATRVGNSNQFGIGESIPAGLASIGNTLYMIGSANDYLSTLDTSTGAATRVGNSNQFGIGESSATGITSSGNTLYMVGLSSSYLSRLDITTGGASRIGTSTNFGIGEGTPAGLASIATTTFMQPQEREILSWGVQIGYSNGISLTVPSAGDRIVFSGGSGGQINQINTTSETITLTLSKNDSLPAISETFIIYNDTGITGASGTVSTITNNTTGGTGLLLANDLDTISKSGNYYIQLLTGMSPTSNNNIYTQTTLVGTASTPIPKIVPKTLLGSYSGTLTGAYGIGVSLPNLSKSDAITPLEGSVQIPPNNAVFTVNGLLATEDNVLVGPSSNGALQINQFSVSNNALISSSDTVEINTSIPTDTPISGNIRVQNNNGIFVRTAYDSYSENIFTLSSTFGDTASVNNSVFISYIDSTASDTSLSFTSTFISPRNLFIRIRDGGVSPTKTFDTTSILSSTGGSVTSNRVADL